MPKRHLFVMDPIHKINPSTDSTYDVMLECQSRGDEVWACQQNELFIQNGIGNAISHRLKLAHAQNESSSFYEILAEKRMAFSEFQFIWMRKNPPIDDNFIATLHVLNCHDRSKTRLVNEPEGLLIANEKLWPLKIAADFMPKTVVSANPKILVEAALFFEKAVVKPLFQSGGAGVMVFPSGDKNLKSALDLLTEQGQSPAMLQKYVDGAELGDKRIILIAGKPAGAVLRVPGQDDNRANLHVGGSALKTEITEREMDICRHLEPHLIANGLYFVGIDVINGYLTEINVTSPTGLQEIDRLDKNQGPSRLRAKLIDWIEENLI